jgi:hypothetical protein
MEASWASENLQIIRTLMERSALYRRALAPIMIVAGSVGLAASVVPCFVAIHSNRGFSMFWMSVSFVAAAAAFLLVRRQSLRDAEPFWSPPTRRVTQALMPGFLIGLTVGAVVAVTGDKLPPQAAPLLALLWIGIYGCALHAAGFFVQRGIRLFGLFLVASGCVLFAILTLSNRSLAPELGHYLMGIFFGLIHVAYGTYLYFTEKRRNAT